MLDPQKIVLLEKILQSAREGLERAERMLADSKNNAGPVDWANLDISSSPVSMEDCTIIEGVFDGQNMIGPDGKPYSISPNYASKSKLVEGDILKLTICPDGRFLYKQIRPIDRDRQKGVLVKDKESGELRVLVENKLYRVLDASVSYFKGGSGDDVIVLVPRGGQSRWAAVENIIKAGNPAMVENEMDEVF
ncbi:MAG: hypothetical protein G01um101418_782 [Parcubacteria group bacterium Gr01-1014_18]|nr:MAG: hypothetical protein Greene041636_748 [Parcubacteria group bacterium Greene0416_36]TSC80147.1 MAG: hypothetical protein G01um101418_782 [Parcubacteria group bacterium Gr01-1014_18]TSC99361.1 MAG: hypothetical protein Greene101420_289 [Parcubacteria group bacterium Greene1014_20]TSD06802.1 MAG: hypothetical protein Greene07142_536 [Parcubacteria group bacterium Greene0714_2]